MTNGLAVICGLVIIGLLGYDYYQYDMGYSLFLARKFLELNEWLKFWR